jgi:4-amino-4-deoxy-L-arabinose transferase-like glycosyltransferase
VRHRSIALALVFLLALGVRCAYIPPTPRTHETSNINGEFAHNIVDNGQWFVINEQALNLVASLEARKNRLVDPAEVDYKAVDAHPHWQPYTVQSIGSPLLLAAMWEITGDERYAYGQALQILADSLAALLIFHVALLLFARRRAALVAAVLYAVFPPIARETTFISQEIWAIDFTIAIVAVYLQALRSPHRRRWLVLCGALAGLSTYFRPSILLLPAALALAGVPWAGWRRQARAAALVTGVGVLLILPWTVYNYVKYHHLVAVRTGLGVTLMVGLAEEHNNFGVVGDENAIREQVHRERPDLVYSTPAYDSYLVHRALHLIAQHPLYYGKLVARRVFISTVGEYESTWMHGGGESPLHYRARTGKGLISYAINRPFDLLQSALQPAIFLLAMLTLALTWRGRGREHALLIALVLATLVPYWMIHVESRYALPATVAYLIWIGLGADLLAERALRSTRRVSARAAAA